jgi:hypothetical protein
MTIDPAVEPLTVYQGASFREHFTWTDENNTPVNLTGYTARMQARPAPESADAFMALTTANGGITLGGAAGTILVQMSAAQTAALPSGGGHYDLELVAADGTVTRLLMGRLYISQEITR